MKNKPAAWMMKSNDPDYVSDYIMFKTPERKDKISHQAVPLYTHPVKELNDGGEPVKNATYWKRQYNLMATQNDNLKSGLYHVNEQIKYLESHLVKELTDEEIMGISGGENLSEQVFFWNKNAVLNFARAILLKAQEK